MRSQTWGADRIKNVYSDEVGNARLPKKVPGAQEIPAAGALGGSGHWPSGSCRDYRWRVLLLRFARPARSAMGVTEKSIAVLPFENLSEEKQNGISPMAYRTKF